MEARYVRLSMSSTQPACPAKDPYGREVRSMRLSVTQRCDFACSYCHREGQSPSTREMSPNEIGRIVAVAASSGVRKVKLTGGEPLLREDITEIVGKVSPQVAELSLTTNGSRLSSLAKGLHEAGLRRVNVSLHSLNRDTFSRLCGADLSQQVRMGVVAAVSSGLNPVKVNMVVLKGENEQEIEQMMEFCSRVGAILQLIEYETTREGARSVQFASLHFPLDQIEDAFSKEALEITENELHRRRRYLMRANGGSVTVEVVRPMHNTEFCSNCTRIRMTSDGLLKPCLLDPSGTVDMLTPMRGGASDEELKALFSKAVANRRPYWR